MALLITVLTNMSTTFYNDLWLMHGNTGTRPAEPIRLVKRDYYCIQYNHAGAITVQIDDRPPQSVIGPSVLITSPGHRFAFGCPGGWHHNYIAFGGPRVDRYIESGLLPLSRPVQQVHDSIGFLALFETCVQALRKRALPEASHALEGLLLRLQMPPSAIEETPHYEDVRQLAVAMREAPTEEYNLTQEAAWIHISEAHLRRLFRRLVGCGPMQYLLQCRLAAAADRLAATCDPIKQVAADCGFESIHHFTRAFRKQYSLPPGRFRREILGS